MLTNEKVLRGKKFKVAIVPFFRIINLFVMIFASIGSAKKVKLKPSYGALKGQLQKILTTLNFSTPNIFIYTHVDRTIWISN